MPPKWHSPANRDSYEPLWSSDHTWINYSMNGHWNRHDKAKVIIERGWGVGDVWLWPISFQFPLVPPLNPVDPNWPLLRSHWKRCDCPSKKEWKILVPPSTLMITNGWSLRNAWLMFKKWPKTYQVQWRCAYFYLKYVLLILENPTWYR